MPVPSMPQPKPISSKAVAETDDMGVEEVGKNISTSFPLKLDEEQQTNEENRQQPRGDLVEIPLTETQIDSKSSPSNSSAIDVADGAQSSEQKFSARQTELPAGERIPQKNPLPILNNQKTDATTEILAVPVISSIEKKKFTPEATAAPANKNLSYRRNAKSQSSNTSSDQTQTLRLVKPLNTVAKVDTKVVPKFPIVTADDRVKNAVALLNLGEINKAEKELDDALVIEPNNLSARKLIRQLHQSPGDYYSDEQFFEYVLRPNETLIEVAERFLQDPLEFHMLAKLNNIKDPINLVPGKILKIPGETELNDRVNEAAVKPEAVKSKPVEQKKTAELIKYERAKVYVDEHRFQEAIGLLSEVAGAAGFNHKNQAKELLVRSYIKRAEFLENKKNLVEAQIILETAANTFPDNKKLYSRLKKIKSKREANRLFQTALIQNKSGNTEKAFKTFSKVLQLDPNHNLAKKQIVDMKLTVVASYHKKAMVLYRKQELSQAIAIWNDILELDPHHSLAKQYRAKALELKRKIEQL